MKRFGFTLAEVLITLVIIGVIAAMTIPTLMNSTNQQEFRVGLKKGISAINQAMSLNYALEGMEIPASSSDAGLDLSSAAKVVSNLFQKRMSVISTATSGTAFATDANAGVPTNLFYTADGMRFGLSGFTTAGTTVDGETYYAVLTIDVNGDKGPNTMTTSSATPRDTYVASVFSNRVVAGIPGNNTGSSQAAKEVMFDKK